MPNTDLILIIKNLKEPMVYLVDQNHKLLEAYPTTAENLDELVDELILYYEISEIKRT